MLYEREHELAAVSAGLDEAAAGRGSVLVLEGPAGIGKSSVLQAARADARERGMAVGVARGSELEAAFAFGVVRQLFEPRLRGMSADARAAVLDGAAALARPVVLADAPLEADPSFGVLHGLYWLLAGLAAQRPCVLVVDDLQWADAASVRFLDFLANRVDTLRVMVVAARRPGVHALSAEPSRVLELAALTPAATAAVFADVGSDAAPDVVDACHAATGGNPLLVRRIAEYSRAHGDGDAQQVLQAGPEAIAGPIRSALARLGPAAVAVAQAVAVLGQAPLAVAARLAALEIDRTAAIGEQLVHAGVLLDARPLRFQHALVRDAVLADVSATARERLHAEAAQVLAELGAPLERVAGHLIQTEPTGNETRAETLALAGRRALASGALEEAAACLLRALAEPPPPAARPAMLLDLARAENGLGRPQALDHVLEAFASASDPEARAHAALALEWASGPGRQDPESALRMIDEAIAEAPDDRELGLRLQALRLWAISMSAEHLREVLGEAERYASLEGRTPAECQLLLHAATHRFLLGRPAEEAAEPLERAVAAPGMIAEIGLDSTWLQFVLGGVYKTDRLDTMRRTLAIATAEAQRRGAAFGYAGVAVWRAWTALRSGLGAEAEADARAAYEALPAGVWQRVFSASCLIEVLVERDALAEAEAVLEASGFGGATGVDRGGELMLSTRSILRLAQGDLRAALDDQLESRRPRGAPTPDPDFDGWLRIARLRHLLGDAEEAAREADQALAWARTWGTDAYIGQALTVAGLVRGGDEGLAALRDAVAHLERSPARRELARSLIELGGALRRRGERAAAREPLRRALDLATAGGLTATAAAARDELRVTGARVRREASHGVDSLTPSERRIAERAAAGATNPQIAQELFVTAKTVEMHLGHAYRKLGISSRRELAARLKT
jgi:DNA-binding CsgD family transcriptional regulator